jgi:hypothetical protein
LKDRAAAAEATMLSAASTAALGGTVEISGGVEYKVIPGKISVVAAFESMQHLKFARRQGIRRLIPQNNKEDGQKRSQNSEMGVAGRGRLLHGAPLEINGQLSVRSGCQSIRKILRQIPMSL